MAKADTKKSKDKPAPDPAAPPVGALAPAGAPTAGAPPAGAPPAGAPVQRIRADPLRGFPKRGWHDSLFPARRRWKCRISFGFRKLGRFCRRIRAAWRALRSPGASGIVHALRNGGRWADCPREVYGPKKTLYNRFVRWAERGIWERIFSALAGGEDAPDRLFIAASRFIAAPAGKGGPWPMVSAAPRGAATPSFTLSGCERQASAPDTRKRP